MARLVFELFSRCDHDEKQRSGNAASNDVLLRAVAQDLVDSRAEGAAEDATTTSSAASSTRSASGNQ